MEAEIGMKQPQVKECRESLEAGGSKDSPPEPWWEHSPAGTFRLPVSRRERESISVVLSLPGRGHLLQEPE